MAKTKKQAKESKSVNFFVPMVDLMVSIIFVFIIIVMVLLLLITSESKSPSESEVINEAEATASSIATGNPLKASVIESTVKNQSAKEILVNDVVREFLKKEGSNSVFDAEKGKLEIRIKKPVTGK